MSTPVTYLPNEMYDQFLRMMVGDIKKMASPKELQEAGKNLLEVSLTDKRFSQICLPILSEIEIAYNRLQEKIESYKDTFNTGTEKNAELVAACFLALTMDSDYDKEFDDSIKEMATLMPDTLNSTAGKIRAFSGLTPLYLASINEKMPVDTIRFLIEKGANPHRLREDAPKGIPPELQQWVGPERYKQIVDLLKEFDVN